MPIAIRETIVTPGEKGGAVIQLRISDAESPDAPEATVLVLRVPVSAHDTAALGAYQRYAMSEAQDVLSGLLQPMAHQLADAGFRATLNPKRG